MRAPVVLVLGVASTALGMGLFACVNLFHSTADLHTACGIDAQTPGCTQEASVEAGPEAATDFCSWKYPEPLAHAQHACAWLGACESPLGRNAYGSCMFNALLAYDCTTNPGHPVQGKTHELWDCLWQAQSCNAVTACVFPKGPQRCDGTGTGCGNVDGSAPNNLDVRVDCVVDGGEAEGENCALWGQTCAPKGGVCSGSSIRATVRTSATAPTSTSAPTRATSVSTAPETARSNARSSEPGRSGPHACRRAMRGRARRMRRRRA